MENISLLVTMSYKRAYLLGVLSAAKSSVSSESAAVSVVEVVVYDEQGGKTRPRLTFCASDMTLWGRKK